jgi:hypothetical protein
LVTTRTYRGDNYGAVTGGGLGNSNLYSRLITEPEKDVDQRAPVAKC